MIKDLEKKQCELIVEENYVKGDIHKLLETLKTLKISTYSSNNDIDKEYLKFIGTVIVKFEIILELLSTKKLEKNRNDFKELGKYIQKFGQEIMNHDFTNKNKTKKYSDKKNNKDFEKELTKELEKALNELFGSLLNDISGEE